MPIERRRTVRRDPNAPDVRALEEARRGLERHRESLDTARRTLDGTLERARDTLRGYKRPLTDAVDDRRNGLGAEMSSLDHFDAALERAKKQTKRVHAPSGSSNDV